MAELVFAFNPANMACTQVEQCAAIGARGAIGISCLPRYVGMAGGLNMGLSGPELAAPPLRQSGSS